MIKLVGALIIFLLVLVIIGGRRVFGGAKGLWKKAKAMADEKESSLAEDPELDEKYRHLNLFLRAQELLLTMGGTKKLSLTNEKEKLRYLHFVLGAIDQLSRTIRDQERRELWITNIDSSRNHTFPC